MAKKQKALNSMLKSLMIAHDYEYVDAGHLKDFNQSTKAEYENIRKLFNISGPPSDPVHITPQVYSKLSKSLGSLDDDSQYMFFSKTLLLGYWTNHKVVYRIPKETIQFITEKFEIRYSNLNINRVVNKLCKEPIYVEIDGGCNYFCGVSSFPYHKLGNITEGNLPLVSIMIDKNQSYRHVSRFENTSVRDYFDSIQDGSANADPRFDILVKVLTYISYVKDMKDALGNTLMPNTSKPYPYMTVRPNPFEDCIPDLKNPEGWIPVGLCNAVHYLSRQNMLNAFRLSVGGKKFTDNIFEFADSEALTIDDEHIERFLQWLTLQWESCKVVYRYESETVEKLSRKYDAADIGEDAELLKYIPYPVIALSNPGIGQVSLVCTCRFKLPDQQLYNGVIIYCSIEQEDVFCFLPSGVPAEYRNAYIRSSSQRYNAAAYDAVLATMHILKVMQQKALKNIAKGLLNQGNPVSTALLPVEEYEPHTAKDKNDDSPAVYEGYDIAGEDFILNDITVRTVKRVPRKDAETRIGWHVRPHVRRGHPHRFWVGSGEERHLEVRILKPMQVNCFDDGPDKPTIHELKS